MNNIRKYDSREEQELIKIFAGMTESPFSSNSDSSQFSDSINSTNAWFLTFTVSLKLFTS